MAKLRFIKALTGFSGPILSLTLHFAVTLCYINRWDKVTAVTVFPLWSWAIIGPVRAWFATANQSCSGL